MTPETQIPDYQEWLAGKQAKTAGVRPGLTWGAARKGHRHEGQDFGGGMDTDVGSADAGEVIFAGPNGNMGNAVKIKHPSGIVSVYGHLDRIDVKQGDRLDAGASIGLLGQTGNAKGPHVHFETYKDDLPIDPAGTSLKPRIGAAKMSTTVDKPAIPAQQPSPEIPSFDDWVKTRQQATPDAQESQDAPQESAPLKTPNVSMTMSDGAVDESKPLPAAAPIAFQRGSAMPRKAGPTELMMRPFDEAPKGTVEQQLTEQRYKTPPSTELAQAVKIPYSPHLNPSPDELVSAYLATLGPDYAKYGERYKRETGRNILALGEGDLDRDPDGSIYVKPTRAAVDVLNAYVKSGGKLEAAQAEGARIAQERRGATSEAERLAEPDIAEVERGRKGLATFSADRRAVASPVIRYGAGKIQQVGGLISGFGIAPNSLSDYLNTRGKIMELGASLPPLTPQGQEIQRSVPEKVGSGLADLGLGVFDIIAMKKATGLSTGQVMALEAALRDSDAPLPQRAIKTAQAYAMGRILDEHLSRTMSSAIFAVPTAVEGAQQVARGEKSPTDALLDVAIQGGAGAILAGGKESDYRTPEVQARESIGIDRAQTVPDFERALTRREDAVKPPLDAIPEEQLARPAQPRAQPKQPLERPTISRAVEPYAGDPQFRGLNEDQLWQLTEQRPPKGTTRGKRAELLQRQSDARAELQRRAADAPLQPVNPPTAGEAQPREDVPSFQEYVENRPGGGLRFDSLTPDSPEMDQLVGEYLKLYGNTDTPQATTRATAQPARPEAGRPATATPPADPQQAIRDYLDETDQTIEQVTSDVDMRNQRDVTADTAEMIQERLREQGAQVPLEQITRALYDLRDQEQTQPRQAPDFDQWVKQKEMAPGQPKPVVPEKPTKAAAPVRRELNPVEPISVGRESRAVTDRGSEIDSRYAVVDSDKLVTSHDSALRPNPDFPAELQPRERDRAASADQISRIASQLRPEFLGESPKASEGAPIVGPDGIVESGNGRVLALRQAYESNNQGSRAYRNFLMENAERLGLDPEAISSAKSPVLVRIRSTDVDRAQFVKEANEQSVASMSPVEQARSDATALKGPLLDLFRPSESGEINTSGNINFVRAFMKDVVGPNEVNRYVTASGHVSQEGVARIRNAIFARAYGDSPQGLIALEKLAESPDNNVRNITTAMLRNAAGFASLKEGIDQGTRYPIDIAPDISAAMSKMSSLRESGTTVSDYINQGELYGAELTPIQKRLLQVFDEYKRGANIIDGILKNYVRAADAAGSPTQGGLFGVEAPSKADFLEAAIREAIDAQGSTTRSLFPSTDQGLPSQPASRGADQATDTQIAERTPTLKETTANQNQGDPVGRFDSTIDRLKSQEAEARQRLAQRAAEAGKLFEEKGSELGATSIPQDLYDLVVVGASKLAQRTLSVAQFIEEMVKDFGDAVRSRAREIFNLSRKMVADTQAQIRNERVSKEIADRLFTENVPQDQQREAMRIAARFRTTSDTQGRFLSGFKSRVGEMARSYGAAGGELTNRLHLGDIARGHEMEAGNTYLSRIKDVYDGIKNDFERQRVSEAVINALENRADADRYLDTPQKQAVFKDTKDMLDEFRTKLDALGYETRDDYFTHMRDVDVLDQILSDAKDPKEANLNELVNAKSRFLQTRDDAKIEIKKDLPRVLFAYLKSVTKEIAYSDAVDYYYNHFVNDIPISLRQNSMERAIKAMQNSLNPEQGRGPFYRVAGKLRAEQYRNFLAYNLKASAQNFTQVDFARMRWTKEATKLAGKMWRRRETLTGPLADAISIASTEETPLMRFLEQFKGDDPSGTRGRFAEAFNRYDPFQKSEKRNWALSELGSIINNVVKRPEYQSLKKELGAEGAINELLKKQDVFDSAVREAATTAAETQVASNPAMRGEFYDAPLHRIIGMFTAFKTRQIQILAEALRSHEGINGARAQTILRRGLTGDALPVEVLREVETQRQALEKMLKRARKFDEDLGISNRDVAEMIDHLKTQEGELNSIIKRIEPLSGSRARSAVLVGKYFAKVAAISVFFNLFWGSVYDAIAGKEKDQDAEERLSTALKRAFWDVLPSPFYGADPSKFLVSPIAPNFERSAPYGRITRRGLATDAVSYGSSVIPLAGVLDRATGRRLSRSVVDVIAPKKGREKKPEF